MFRGKKINLFVCRFWLVAILFSINIDDAHGWGPQGHRVIGYIADFNLTPDTKKNIVEEFNINNLADIANWADKVKRYKNQEKTMALHQCKRRRMGLCDVTRLPKGELLY